MLRYNEYDERTINKLGLINIYVYPEDHRLIFSCHGPEFEYQYRYSAYKNLKDNINLVIKRKSKGRFHVIPPFGPISELKPYLTYEFATGTLGAYGQFMSSKDKLVRANQKRWLDAVKMITPRVLAMFRLTPPNLENSGYSGNESCLYSRRTTDCLFESLSTGVVNPRLLEIVAMPKEYAIWHALHHGDTTQQMAAVTTALAWLIDLHKHELRKRFGVWGDYHE